MKLRIHRWKWTAAWGGLGRRGSALVLLGAGGTLFPLAADDAEFFESRIRPVLVESCYECHSAQSAQVKGGLRIDTREGLRQGGQSGAAIVPGDPDRSLLIQAIRHQRDDLRMPYKKTKLADEVLADFEAWIRMGAPDPRVDRAEADEPAVKAGRHWAFQPIRLPPLPSVERANLIRTPVDAFILERLERKGLSLNPRADRRTLIRRAWFDLLGLPPAPEDVAAFEADERADAYDRLVDQLLDSPHYGERWGRYWLDVARYADTKGYLAGGAQRRFAFSYTYRDYVIRAFNDDLPFDRFILEQLAADHLDLSGDKRALAALGYLTLGRRFLNNPHDIIDDRIDVVTRGMMGLTVTCARCHDHKFDPIPTADYYSLYGVFSNSREPDEKPLLGTQAPEPLYQEYLAEKQRRQDKLDAFRRDKVAEGRAELRKRAGDYLALAQDASAQDQKEELNDLAQNSKLIPGVVRRWMEALKSWQAEPYPVFVPWFSLVALPPEQWASEWPRLVEQWEAQAEPARSVLLLVARRAQEERPGTLRELASVYGKLFQEADRRWRETLDQESPPPPALADPVWEAVRAVLYAEGAPANLPEDQTDQLLGAARPRLRELKAEIDEVDAVHPGAPPRAMVLEDASSIRQPNVFLRGNPNNRGPEVPMQFLELLAGRDRQPFTHGSGRLELARAIASPSNPLTSRVIVNRVWMHHFTKPLVRTPSDFGTRADPPTHPELLDYLASTFMSEGWSLKQLHRLIMRSWTYQQSSDSPAEAMAVDSDNELLWRMNRRRLDFESMRDTLLSVSGQLDLTLGGRSEEIATDDPSKRRAVYGFIERQNLPGLFRTFDFASPDTTSPGRFSTTVPQQALYLMNSPFIAQQARGLLSRPEIQTCSGPEEKVSRLYQIAYQRDPAPDEKRLALDFLNARPEREELDPRRVWQYGYGTFDAEQGRVAEFHPLPHFNHYAWQGGPELPDPKLNWVLLRAEGGHPGNGPNLAAIRRWRVPESGVIRIDGQLEHPSEPGDGVRSRVVSSRSGLLGEWVVHHGETETALEGVRVEKGESIDFVTDCRTNESHDSFHWAPIIHYANVDPERVAEIPIEWEASRQFSGPLSEPDTLSPWEELAQVILVSNELFFVD